MGVALLVGGVAPGCSRRAPTARAPVTPLPFDAGAGPQELGPFRLGQATRGPLALALTLEMGQAHGAQKMQIAADWTTTPTDIHDGVVEIACHLSGVRMTLQAPPARGVPAGAAQTRRAEQDEAARGLGAALEAPTFFVTAGPSGAFTGVWFPRDLNPAVANVLLTLVGAQQLVRPAATGPAWIVEEQDSNGVYLAAYQQLGPDRFKKQKARYLPPGPKAKPTDLAARGVSAPAAASPLVHVDDSTFELTTAPSTSTLIGPVRALKGQETLTVSLGNGALSFKTRVDLRWGETSSADAPERRGAFTRARAALEWRPLQPTPGDDGQATALDRALLAGAGWPDLSAVLSALPRDVASNDPEASRLLRRFVALFRLQPAAAARAPEPLRHQPPARAKLVVDALSLAVTPEAAKALGVIATDAAAPPLARRSAVQYLAHEPRPPAEAVASLASLLDDPDPALRQMALLAYGASALNLRASDGARGDAIVSALLQRLDHARDDDARADLIAALGNAGSARALPALEAPIARRDLRLGLRAVSALRFIDDDRVDRLLGSLLGIDTDVPFRRAAIETLRFREIGPFAQALTLVALHDPVPEVRNLAVALLGDRLSELPTLRGVLEDVRTKDPFPANRALAARSLGVAPQTILDKTVLGKKVP